MAIIKALMNEQRIKELKSEYVRDLFAVPSLESCKMIAINDEILRNGGDYRNIEHEKLSYKCNLKGLSQIYKYVDLDGFTKLLQRGFLFKEPSQWEDPYEKLFYRTSEKKYEGVSQEHFPPLYACCAAANIEESVSAWKMYIKGGGMSSKCVRLTIDMHSFLELMNVYAKYHQCHAYYGAVTYINKEEDIDMFYDGAKNRYLRFGGFGINNYLSLMLVKRPAFSPEKEIRFFISQDNGSLSNDGFVNVGGTPCLNTIVRRVVLDPWCSDADVMYVKSICDEASLSCDILRCNLLKKDFPKDNVFSTNNIGNPWKS